MLQEIIVNLQHENKLLFVFVIIKQEILLACVDIAMILSNGKIIAEDTPSNLVKKYKCKKMLILVIILNLINNLMSKSLIN